jgi:antitoxin YefM
VYSEARANLAALLDRATQDRETVIITRRGGAPAALIAADDLASLLETVYLLRAPATAERLLSALARAKAGAGTPMTLDKLTEAVGPGSA